MNPDRLGGTSLSHMSRGHSSLQKTFPLGLERIILLNYIHHGVGTYFVKTEYVSEFLHIDEYIQDYEEETIRSMCRRTGHRMAVVDIFSQERRGKKRTVHRILASKQEEIMQKEFFHLNCTVPPLVVE